MPTDISYAVPSSVTVVFPRVIGGSVVSHPYPVVVQLADLELDEYDGVAGFSGTKTIWASPRAEDDGSGTVANAAALDAYADALAGDWYLWQLGPAESRYEGVLAWTMEAHTELVEFEHSIDRISTRTMRGPWLDHFEGEWTPPEEDESGEGGPCHNNLAALQTTDCLLAVETEAGSSSSAIMVWNGVLPWVSITDITYYGTAGKLVFFWDTSLAKFRLWLTLPPVGSAAYGAYADLDDCGDGCWVGGPMTGHEPASGRGPCDGRTFKICLSCTPCPTVEPPCCDRPLPTHMPFDWEGLDTGLTPCWDGWTGTTLAVWDADESAWYVEVVTATHSLEFWIYCTGNETCPVAIFGNISSLAPPCDVGGPLTVVFVPGCPPANYEIVSFECEPFRVEILLYTGDLRIVLRES